MRLVVAAVSWAPPLAGSFLSGLAHVPWPAAFGLAVLATATAATLEWRREENRHKEVRYVLAKAPQAKVDATEALRILRGRPQRSWRRR